MYRYSACVSCVCVCVLLNLRLLIACFLFCNLSFKPVLQTSHDTPHPALLMHYRDQEHSIPFHFPVPSLAGEAVGSSRSIWLLFKSLSWHRIILWSCCTPQWPCGERLLGCLFVVLMTWELTSPPSCMYVLLISQKPEHRRHLKKIRQGNLNHTNEPQSGTSVQLIMRSRPLPPTLHTFDLLHTNMLKRVNEAIRMHTLHDIILTSCPTLLHRKFTMGKRSRAEYSRMSSGFTAIAFSARAHATISSPTSFPSPPGYSQHGLLSSYCNPV